jgi:hypothetical protein
MSGDGDSGDRDWFEDPDLSFDDAVARFETLGPDVTVGPPDPEPELSVWLRSERSPTGEYIVTMSVGEDYAIELSIELALGYAMEVLHSVQLAEYARAMTVQMKELLPSAEAIAQLVRDVLVDIAPATAVTDLSMAPAVNRANGEPLIQVTFRDETLGIWSLQQARDHALFVLEATLAVRMDNTYSKVLTEVVGLDTSTASAVVEDVGQYRWQR